MNGARTGWATAPRQPGAPDGHERRSRWRARLRIRRSGGGRIPQGALRICAGQRPARSCFSRESPVSPWSKGPWPSATPLVRLRSDAPRCLSLINRSTLALRLSAWRAVMRNSLNLPDHHQGAIPQGAIPGFFVNKIIAPSRPTSSRSCVLAATAAAGAPPLTPPASVASWQPTKIPNHLLTDPIPSGMTKGLDVSESPGCRWVVVRMCAVRP
jgi:hypothetical protein